MKVEYDHLDGRDAHQGVDSLTIIGQGIYSQAGQIAEFALVHGSLTLKDMQGRLLGSLSVEDDHAACTHAECQERAERAVAFPFQSNPAKLFVGNYCGEHAAEVLKQPGAKEAVEA